MPDEPAATRNAIELITHLAFYAGWPTANTAVAIASEAFETAVR